MRNLLDDGWKRLATLTAVVTFYAVPTLAFIASYNTPNFDAEPFMLAEMVRPDVVWMPAQEDEGNSAEDANVDEGEEGAEAAEPTQEAPTESASSPEDAGAEAADELAVASSKSRVVRRAGKNQRSRRRVVAKRSTKKKKKRELTKKQLKRVEKRAKKRERMAKRKQCADFADQIIVLSDTKRLVGRELMNCYRTHLDQFDMLGGAYWSKNEDGEKNGIRIRPSRRSVVAKASGFQSKDVVVSLNGTKMKTWSGVSIAAAKAAFAGKFKVKILRNGDPITMVFDIVSDKKLQKARESVAVAEAY